MKLRQAETVIRPRHLLAYGLVSDIGVHDCGIAIRRNSESKYILESPL